MNSRITRHRIKSRRRNSRMNSRTNSRTNSRRISNRRKSRRRVYKMRGGVREDQSARFIIDRLAYHEANNDDAIDNDTMIELISQNHNTFLNLFNEVVNELMESGQISLAIFENFVFKHVGNNRFEMKFVSIDQEPVNVRNTINILLHNISSRGLVELPETGLLSLRVALAAD